MFDFNFFKSLSIKQLIISESLKLFEYPNYIKTNYELDDFTNFNENILYVGYNFNDDEINMITEDNNIIKYVLFLDKNIKIPNELLNKDFIKFIVTNKKIEDELNLNNIRFIVLPSFCIWVDKHKFNKIYNHQNKILIYNGFSNADEQYCNLKQTVEIKRNVPSKNYIYTKSLNLNNPNINLLLNNVSLFIYLTNHKTFETEKLLSILNLLNIKIVSNNYYIESINYIDTQELINIVKYNINNDYTYNNFFTKQGIEQILISKEKNKYGGIRYLYNLNDFEIKYLLDKDSFSKKIILMGIDDENYTLAKQFTGPLYYLWTDEDEYEMILKLNKYSILSNFIHLSNLEYQEKILKQHNISKIEKININLFMCKINNYELINKIDTNISNKNILINNEYDDFNDNFLKTKFESTKYNIYFLDKIENDINFKYFIDLSYYYNSKLDKLLLFCQQNNICIFTNNLPEQPNIKNFNDLEEIILEINGI